MVSRTMENETMARYSKAALKAMQATLDAGKNCSHLPEKQHQIGYGIFCDDCKCRTGFITQEQSMKSILDYVKSMGVK